MLDRTRFELEISSLRQFDVTAPPGRSVYLQIERNATLKGRAVGVYVPDAARTAARFDVIVYFHGFVDKQCHEGAPRGCDADWAKFRKLGIQYYWSSERFSHLRPELEDSGRAAVLIAPTLGACVGRSKTSADLYGNLNRDGKFDSLIDSVLDSLRASKTITANAQIGHIVLAAHSGGGAPMKAVLSARNKHHPKIRACWGFECLYGSTEPFQTWLLQDKRRRFRHFRRPKVFAREAAAIGLPKQFEDSVGNTEHCDLPKCHWKDLLATLPAAPGDPQTDFELQSESEILPAAKPNCVAEGFDLVDTACALDGPKVEQTKSAAPYMEEARKYFEALQPEYKKRAPHGSFGMRGFRDAKEYELGATFVDRAIGLLQTVQYKTRVGATVGGYWRMLDTTMQGARYFFEIAADECVSKELADAPVYRPRLMPNNKLKLRPCEIRVVAWIKRYRSYFDAGAKKFRITPLAAAAAIAWEALENPLFFTLRAAGPGKAHVRTSAMPWMGSDDTLVKQIETAGYMPAKSAWDRERLLKTSRGAIEYVSAMMGAGADAAESLGFNIRQDPAVLTAFYQAYDLNSWKIHLVNKRAKGETTFRAIDSMATWTANKLPMLKLALGLKA